MAKKVAKKAVKKDNGHITGMHIRVLQALKSGRKEMTRDELGKATGILKGYSKMTRILTNAGYITSEHYESERSHKHAITAKGKQFLETTDIVPRGSASPKKPAGKVTKKQAAPKANKPAAKKGKKPTPKAAVKTESVATAG